MLHATGAATREFVARAPKLTFRTRERTPRRPVDYARAAAMRRAPVLALALCLAACQSSPAEPEGRPTPASVSASAAPAASSAAPPPAIDPDAARYVASLNAFCVITQEVKADAKIPDKQKPLAIVKKLLAGDPPPSFLRMVQGLGDLAAANRYAALRRAAAEHGAPQWSCPALAGD